MIAKRFVGFGFGPIQTGLMLCEAAASGSFSDYAVAEVDAGLVQAVRDQGNAVSINIARQGGVSTVRLSGIRLLNPRVASDRAALVEAIAQADEMATAIPSVSFYSAGGDASIAALIAEGVGPDRPRVIYAAENNNFAAEILRDEVLKRAPSSRFARLQFLNTVVGKMSGVISSAEEMRRLGLAPLVPGYEKCVLVEEFNRIYISKITLPGFSRGIRVFEEKEDLLPFEEAKLFGHNAIHALLGYLANARGLTVMSEIRGDAALMALGRRAFIEESGAALIRKHGGLGDPLFTEKGYAAYADDLLARMTNPFLNDRVERIIRDPRRKLGYGDRLFGTMREALRQGIRPLTMARGAAAAVTYAIHEEMRLGRREEMRLGRREEMRLGRHEESGKPAADRPAAPRQWLLDLWAAEKADEYREECLRMVLESLAG
jgi:mannitol-1-phosphate 5-dehydrogenase